MIANRDSYGRGIRVMVLIILPLTLLAWSILIWQDAEESSSLAQSIANNALPLYAFSTIPGALLSALHTRILAGMKTEGGFDLQMKSASIGSFLGAALAGVLSIVLFRTLNPGLWPFWVWGAVWDWSTACFAPALNGSAEEPLATPESNET
jgi:hypothetical protein